MSPQPPARLPLPAFLQQMRETLGPEAVSDDDARRDLMSRDVYAQGGEPLMVVRPANTAAVQKAVALCSAAGVAMVPRGGGASYTDGYLLPEGGHVLFDLGALQDISIDASQSVVTVGAGVTWAALRDTLAPLGLRTPFWGPFSGLVATVAGSVSQNAISHGSATHGITAQSVQSVDVVLASGELLSTGLSTASRFDGPDLTGLFTGDCGALGIKVAVRLPLIAAHNDFEALSFAFEDFKTFHAGLHSAAREGLEDESFGLDRALSQGQIGRQGGLGDKMAAALKVFRTAPSVLAGVRQLVRMAMAGDKVLGLGAYMAHFIVEGSNAAEARAKAQRLRLLMVQAGGREIANTVPGFVRAMPFAPLTNILGPQGERWVPVHGIVPHSQAMAFHNALQAFWGRNEADMKRLGVWFGTMFSTVGSTGLLYEIALYWPDATTSFHAAMTPPGHLETVKAYPPNAEAAALVARIKRDLIALYGEHNPAHFQIGRAYPYMQRLQPQALSLLNAIKGTLDPQHLMNPGALGLGATRPPAEPAASI
jgi:glycolate oxidase